MQARLLAALAEPNRIRIVELLGAAPRPVGEIALVLGLRQPQVTKHLQTLERAGLVTVHPLGARRVYALRREPLRELRAWLGAFADDHPSEDALVQYRRAIEAERNGGGPGETRTLAFERGLPAPPHTAWHAWTSADVVRRWWSPRHFTVTECEVDPVVGGRLHIVLAEGDGTRHAASGRFLTVRRPHLLRFEYAPVDAAGVPLFSAEHELRLASRDGGTALTLAIRLTEPGHGGHVDHAPLLAGMGMGWEQMLDKLATELPDLGLAGEAAVDHPRER